jgi:tripartite-type tricarboxylate transporter receptor subunit TctC
MLQMYRYALPVALAMSLAPATGFAQSFPTKAVRVIVVFPPGGSNDVTARIVFRKMPELAGQQFIIDNRGGAAGTIGAASVAKSDADGYTIMVQSTTHIANAFMYKGKLPYDTLKSFIGLTPLAQQVGMLVVHPSLPVKSTKELIALAKRQPGKIDYGSAGNGSFVHLGMEQFLFATKTKIAHVPYRGGGPLSIALLAGEVQTTIGTIGAFIRHIKANKMRALGVTSSKPLPQFPDVPTVGSAVPGFEWTAWVGAFVPAGTPAPVVEKLNLLLKQALADQKVAKMLTDATLIPMYMTPAQFDARLHDDYKKYGDVMKKVGLVK